MLYIISDLTLFIQEFKAVIRKGSKIFKCKLHLIGMYFVWIGIKHLFFFRLTTFSVIPTKFVTTNKFTFRCGLHTLAISKSLESSFCFNMFNILPPIFPTPSLTLFCHLNLHKFFIKVVKISHLQ